MRVLPALLWISLSAACADLEDLRPGECGNGVREANEDCDAFAPPGARCGAPGDAVLACRYSCAAAASCPDGWSCGEDALCRRASGRFAEVGEAQPLPAERLELADVDGDRREDLVGWAPGLLTVRFGDEARRFEEVFAQRVPTAPDLAVGHLDADPTADVLLASASGALTLLGDPARRLSPLFHSPFQPLPETAWVIPFSSIAGPATLVLRQDAGTAFAVAYGVPYCDLGWSGPVDLDGLERVPIGDLDGDGVDEAVLAEVDATRATVLTTRLRSSGSHECTAVSEAASIRLPPGHRIDAGGALLVELDGTSPLEVLLSVTFVASGERSILSWSATSPEEPAHHEPRFDPHVAASSARGEPFLLRVASDLDGDGHDDFVTSEAILRTDPSTGTLDRVASAAEPWTAAVAGQFDETDGPDILVTTERGMSLFTNEHTGFAELALSGLAPAVRLFAADLDPGAAFDEALVVGADGTLSLLRHARSEERSLTFVAKAPLLARVTMGMLPRVNGTGSATGIPGFVLVNRGAADATVEVGILEAAGGAVFSPWTLVDQEQGATNVTRMSLIGRFAADGAEGGGILALGEDDDGLVWWRGSAREGTLSDPQRLSVEAPAAAASARWVVGDLDADGRDEALGLATSPASSALLVVDPQLPATEMQRTVSVDLGSSPTPVDLRAIDVDRDGRSDAVIVLDDAVVVAWAPAFEELARLRGSFRAVAAVRADGDDDLEIAALSADGVHLFDAGPHRELRRRTDVVPTPPGNLLRSADLDRDGIDDLVVGDGGRAWILRGVAQTAGDP